MTTIGHIRTACGLLVVVIFSAVVLLGQGTQRLYVVTGLAPTNMDPWGVGASLFAIDERHSAAIKISELGGASSIIVNHDQNLVVVGNGPGAVVLDMRSPASPHTLTTGFGGPFLCTPPKSTIEVGCVDVYGLEKRLLGIDLTGSNAGVRRSLPSDYFKFARTEGYWSPIDVEHGGIFLFYKNGKLLFHSTEEATDSGIPLPRNVEPCANARDIMLAVSNDDMVVLDCYRQPTPTTEIHAFQVYDRKLGTWQSAKLDAGPSVRGFGPWIASASFVRKRPIGASASGPEIKSEPQSPGAEFRKRIINPQSRDQDQASLDDRFQRYPWLFTGDLHLFNIRSKQSYMIRTGQGDSEILLVDGNTVYYRVNDTLYKAIIRQQRELNGTKILSSPDVQFAHWAFLGS